MSAPGRRRLPGPPEEAKLGRAGEVIGVTAKGGASIPAELSACIVAVLRSTRFAPPEGAATVTLPMTITRQ